MKIYGLLNCVMKVLIGFLNSAVESKKNICIYCWKGKSATDFMQVCLPSPVPSIFLIIKTHTDTHTHPRAEMEREEEKRKVALCGVKYSQRKEKWDSSLQSVYIIKWKLLCTLCGSGPFSKVKNILPTLYSLHLPYPLCLISQTEHRPCNDR